MPSAAEFRAREIARRAGYDPDQIVTPLCKERDYDYLTIGVAPVDMKNLQPLFFKFLDMAEKELAEEKSSLSLAT